MHKDVQKELPLNTFDFLVLAALEAEPSHGYGLVRRIEEQTGGAARVRPGDLYRVLFRLVRRGLLAKEGTDARRTYYRLTGLGRRVLHAEARMLSGVIAVVQGVDGA